MTTRKTQTAGKKAVRRGGQEPDKAEARRPSGKVDVVASEPTLDELATTANEEHARAFGAGVQMLEHAIAAGRALIAAHAQVDHGEWLKWLAQHFDGSERTAQAYVRV